MKLQECSLIGTTFKELSKRSLELIKGAYLVPRDENILYSYIPLLDTGDLNDLYGDLIYPFRKIKLTYNITGVDSSIIPLAESNKGYVFGLRGAAVSYDPHTNRYKVYIEGPTLFYFTKETLDLLRNYIRERFLDRISRLISYVYAKKILITVYEWMFIRNLLSKSKNSIFLIDGVVEPRHLSNEFYKDILQISKLNNNPLIGISKRSRYLKYFSGVASLLRLLNIEGAIPIDVPGKHESKVFISLFRKGGYPFRVDILKQSNLHILNEIYSSTLSIIGYPEILKEAHILSKLGKKDVLILRSILSKVGSNLRYTYPYRELILGAFEYRGEAFEAV